MQLLWICVKFYIWQASEYSRILNMPGVMPRLHRVLNKLEYAWICLNNARICVNISIVWMILFTYGTLTASRKLISIHWMLLCSYCILHIGLTLYRQEIIDVPYLPMQQSNESMMLYYIRKPICSVIFRHI